MRLDLQIHQLLNQDQADVQERHGQLRATDHHLRLAAALSRHIVRRQTVGVDVCISCVGFMLYGWVLLRFICAVCGGVCVGLGGVIL